jgi:hypothetical protein
MTSFFRDVVGSLMTCTTFRCSYPSRKANTPVSTSSCKLHINAVKAEIFALDALIDAAVAATVSASVNHIGRWKRMLSHRCHISDPMNAVHDSGLNA